MPAASFVLRLVVSAAGRPPRAVAVVVTSRQRVHDLTGALAKHVGLDVASPVPAFDVWADRALDLDGLVADAGLRSGTEIRLGDEEARSPVRAVLEVRAVGGPMAGERWSVADATSIRIGRTPDCDVDLVRDPAVSRWHLQADAVAGGVTIADLGSSNGTYVDGIRIDGPRAVAGDDVIRVGRTLLQVRRTRPPTRVHVDAGGRVELRRASRRPGVPSATRYRLPEAPSGSSRFRVPVVAAILPAALGLVLYFGTGRNPASLLLALGTPLMILGPQLEDLVLGRFQRRRQRRAFRRDLDRAAVELDEVLRGARRRLHAQAPDACTLADRAQAVLPDLWERRREQDDFLRCRLGWGRRPSGIELASSEQGDAALRAEIQDVAGRHRELTDVPLTVDLLQAGVLGLEGAPDEQEGMARSLVVQAAALHAPQDLSIALIGPPEASATWGWVGWLPHSSTGADSLVAFERDATLRLLERVEQASAPTLLVVVGERPVLRSELARLLESGTGSGLAVVWLSPSQAPAESRAVAQIDRDTGALHLTHIDGSAITGVPDWVSPGYASVVARCLSGVVDPSAPGRQGDLPGSVGLLGCLGLTEATVQQRVTSWWQQHDDALAAPVGDGVAGPVELSIRRHGPHALVAGTSGAGKSELLRAWVAGLAARHSPMRLNFLLVDFKGGTGLAGCQELPHVVGLVTNLESHLLDRVMVSLKAEVDRRERLLREAGEKELVDLERRRPELAPPTLMVVFDEFGQLVKDAPGFIDEVVRLARQGRALGIHLVLGTQRPAGAVTEEIRANTNLRICLRVVSGAESVDVVHVPDAAFIPDWLKGRAYVRISQGRLEQFQVAYPGAVSGLPDGGGPPVVHDLRPWAGGAAYASSGTALEGPSDLQRLIEAARSVNRELALPEPRRPWLPPLPATLSLEALGEPEPGVASLGLVDHPEEQRQSLFTYDLARDGHLLVYGNRGSGKTTLLRTLATSLARGSSPEALHLYVLDHASRQLGDLEHLPHCGSVVFGGDLERTARLLDMLQRENETRKRSGLRPGESGAPRIVLLVDEYSAFREVFETVEHGRYVREFTALVRDGAPHGLHVVIATAQRRSVPGDLATLIGGRVLLRCATDDFDSLGVPRGVYEKLDFPAGRCLTGTTKEAQIAITGGDGTPAVPARAHRAPAIGTLPAVVARETLPAPGRRLEAVIGLEGERLQPVSVSLDATHLVVSGHRGSGRSTALAAVARSLAAGTEPPGLELLALRRRTPLVDLALWQEVAVGSQRCADRLRELAAGLPDDGVWLNRVLLIDDGDELAQSAADTDLEKLARRGRDLGLSLVLAVEPQTSRGYAQWLKEILKDRCGLLLVPDLDADGAPFGVMRLPKPLAWPMRPGRGYLLDRGLTQLVQVAIQT